jgi:hypothetical protein
MTTLMAQRWHRSRRFKGLENCLSFLMTCDLLVKKKNLLTNLIEMENVIKLLA